MEDNFTYDDEADDPKDIKRKKLAFKEQVADAKAQLDRQKSKYYEEINAGVKLTPDQQKAVDFFNRYNEERRSNKIVEQQKTTFDQKTKDVFNKTLKVLNIASVIKDLDLMLKMQVSQRQPRVILIILLTNLLTTKVIPYLMQKVITNLCLQQ